MKVLIMRELPGKAALLGKTFLCRGELIFYHESHKEEWFVDLNSPFGIDQDVANWLDDMGVQKVHHHVLETNRLYSCDVDDLFDYGIKHDLGTITRIYLPAPKWEVQNGLPYRRPWAEHQVIFSAWDNGGGPDVPPSSPKPTNTPILAPNPSNPPTPRDALSNRAA